ncbi:hypothetical protein HPP92_012920 [Vanilla planifolia]|uniref:Uncharacterized protein n=1 Tax=Vanilla planifolia TaxID=51239 RepID=A0A835QUI8_VANPL|nr:hypothetical protein HPP92_013376 [Vanilla planifolia]KAG0478201.1 hypothetical protein HPP92_012920 [Vanilla planifolia]
MSRTPNLPPRCPLQNKCLRTRSLDSSYQLSEEEDKLVAELLGYSSEDPLFEEHPLWLDDLLTDSDTNFQGICHRRSVSDSLTVCQGIDGLSSLKTSNKHPIAVQDSQDPSQTMHGNGLEENCVYGPNSPRQRTKLTNSESAIFNALLEKVPRNKLQCEDISVGSGIPEPNTEGIVHSASCSVESELEKASRRRSGQRSRVRKLQYISDLRKTVELLQTMGAELATKIAILYQQRVALSLENTSLRQQIAMLRHEKIIKDGEHEYLKNEAEKLKIPEGHRRSKSITSIFEPVAPAKDQKRSIWQSLDFGKLSIGEGGVSLNHGLGR